MKKSCAYMGILVLVMQMLFIPLQTAEVHAFGGGDGSAGDPFIIMTALDLSNIRNNLSAYYKLGADIDLAGYDYDGPDDPDTGGWMPIGTDAARFTGKLDGNGFVIRNLTINRTSTDAVGLFGYIGDNAELTNIRLLDIDVKGRNQIGGLTGYSYDGSMIRNSYVIGSVSGTDSVGGLVGNNIGGTIQDSYAQVHVSGGGVYAGGLAGASSGDILSSYATGSVNGIHRVGGLVGANHESGSNSGIIEYSYATGSVSGSNDVAGLAGWNYNGATIRNSYATGSVTGDSNVGGLVAWNYQNGSAIENSYATGHVTGNSNVGGLVGVNNIGGTSTNSYWNTETTGQATSAAGTGKTTAELQSAAAYVGLDFTNVWGIREGETYPYLLAYKPELAADPLAVTAYNLTPGQDELMVTGKVRDNSIGEEVTIHYDIKNSLNVTVTSATYSLYADGGEQSVDRTIPLTGLSDGAYTLTITAADTYNTAVAASPLAFTVNSTPPSLTGLSLSSGVLSPPFAANTTSYSASVTNSVYTMTVTPVTGDVTDTVTVRVNGGAWQPAPGGAASGSLALNPGANSIEIRVDGLNGLQSTYSISVNRDHPAPIEDDTDEEEPATGPEIKVDPSGGVKLIIDLSMIEKVTGPDGTVIELLKLDEETLDEALALLKDAVKPLLTIAVDDSERTVQVQLPAASLASGILTAPNAVIEVELNGTSFQLVIDVLDFAGLAEQLGAEPGELQVNVILARADEAVEEEARQAALAGGYRLAGNVVGFELTVEANGQTLEIGDFGGTYMARAIVADTDATVDNLVGVLYDPEAKMFFFIPSYVGEREDGTSEMVMQSPHNSLYTMLETTRTTFADMNNHWAENDVEVLASKLIVQGVSAERYAPDAYITRAEFTALLVRALGLSVNPISVNLSFQDVPANAWYAPAVESAVTARLVSGITPDRFAPNERITREQMAVMVASALAITGKTSNGADDTDQRLTMFTDRDSIADWAQASVAQAIAAGIITGMPEGTFAPSADATRAQAAVMLKRFLLHVGFIR